MYLQYAITHLLKAYAANKKGELSTDNSPYNQGLAMFAPKARTTSSI